MAVGYLSVSKTTAYASSSWTGTKHGTAQGETIIYSTPTTGTDRITVTVPAEMANAVFNSATLSYDVTYESGGTRRVVLDGSSVTNAALLSKIQETDEFTLTFSWKATGGSGGEGSHSSACAWRNVTIAVDYTPSSGMSGTVTVGTAGTAAYSLDKSSIAVGESASLTLTVSPSTSITAVKAELRATGLSPVVSYTADKSVSSGARASVPFAVQISSALASAMVNHVYAAQICVTFTGADGTSYTSGWVDCENASNKPFNLVKTRTAPVISSVTWSEEGTSHLTTYGGLVGGKTIPIMSFSVTLDTAADADISADSRTVEIGGRSYSLSGNQVTLAPLAGGSVEYTVTVRDSYGQTGTLTGTVTVLTYTAPTLRNAALSRYSASLDTQGQTIYELDDDGTDLWLDAEITCQTSLGTGSNPWTLTITPDGGSAVTVAADQTLATKTYAQDRNALTGSYASTSDFAFVLELTDAFTTVRLSVTVLKAGGIFNIEVSGVAVGMRSTGSENAPIFESAYPAYMRGGVYGADGSRLDEVHDTGWVALTLESLFIQASGWAACAVRLKDGIVYVRGAVTITSSMGSSGSVFKLITTLPDGFRPPQNMLVNSGARSNYTSVEIDADGSVKFWNRQGAAVGTSEVISICATYPVD